MALSRYFFPVGMRRLAEPIFDETKLLIRAWMNILLPNRLMRYRRILAQPDKKLHIGCGSKIFPGWVNMDMNRKADLTCDVREGLPFGDNEVELIYTEHSLEHFYREHDAPNLLRECLRVLKPGGHIRITVPDAEKYIEFYLDRLEPDAKEAIGRMHDRFNGTRMDVVNSAFRWKHQHFYMYDGETLEAFLKEIGFGEVRREDHRKSSVEDFQALDLEQRRFETLYMEATKA